MSSENLRNINKELRAIVIFAMVICVHIAIVMALSFHTTVTHEPTTNIRMLESFMVEAAIGQTAAVPADSVNPDTELVQHTDESEQKDLIQKEYSETSLETLDIERVEDNKTAEIKPANSKAQTQAAHKSLPKSLPTPTPSPKPIPSQTNSTQSQTGSSDITLPITHAKYLNNPHPPYPRQSRRLGEHGHVVVAVQIDVDGTAAQALIKQSSGHTRLDKTALETVLTWKFVPGKKSGVPQKMWVNIPINFVLE